MKKVDNSIYVTKYFLQERYPSLGRSIACSDVRLKSKNQIKKKEILDKKEIIIGTAGAIGVKYKGQQHIIQALGVLKKEGYTNLKYQMAGDGDKTYLENMILKNNVKDCVEFVGNIPHESMFEWFNKLDIYAQPSETEGLPRSVIEAMSCGIPCIGTKVGGIPELLDEKVMFKKGSVEEIKKILVELMDNNLREEQGQKNFEKSKEYNLETLEDKRIKFMREVFEI